MKAKHTPGPWTPSGPMRCDTPDRAGRDDMMDYSTGIDCVAPFTENEHGGFERIEEQSIAIAYGRSPEEAHANARLIAAAPDLLAAAQCAANVLALLKPEVERLAVPDMLRAAIAKATGSAA